MSWIDLFAMVRSLFAGASLFAQGKLYWCLVADLCFLLYNAACFKLRTCTMQPIVYIHAISHNYLDENFISSQVT